MVTNWISLYKKLLGYIFVVFVFLVFVVIPTSYAKADSNQKIIKQVTMASVPDPIPGHSAHQLVLLLAPESGKIFTGTLTYTASKPVEVVVFHEYNPSDKHREKNHGSLLLGDIGGKKYAISVMQFASDIKVTHSSTVNFTGSGVALHTLNGDKFTASATINVIQEKINN